MNDGGRTRTVYLAKMNMLPITTRPHHESNIGSSGCEEIFEMGADVGGNSLGEKQRDPMISRASLPAKLMELQYDRNSGHSE